MKTFFNLLKVLEIIRQHKNSKMYKIFENLDFSREPKMLGNDEFFSNICIFLGQPKIFKTARFENPGNFSPKSF